MRSIGVMVCALLGLGCGPGLKAVETDETGGSCRVDDSDSDWRCQPPIPYMPRKAVDLLFVIDNSGSAAEEQARLAASIDALLEPLAAGDVDIRIGVTTTDDSNPWCGETTSPEHGALVMSSCRGRLDHFLFTGTLPTSKEWACTDYCELEPEQFDALMRPIPSYPDPDAKARPWIESGPRGTNLPEGVTAVQAARCVIPQGIDGCGFESQLESMYQAVHRNWDSDDPSFGFVRDGAVLAIVILTDEADCSDSTVGEEIFLADGSRVFWSDPEAPYPTSAVCWNAGVACTGGPGNYDECHAVDKGVDGEPTDDPDQAALRPVDRYVRFIQEIQASKRAFDPDSDVLLAVIAGVPEGYVQGDLQGLYRDTDDPVFQGDFGIGPGCMGAESSTAVPPVRMRELEEGFGEPHMYSVCADDYRPAMEDLADDIKAHMREPCYRACVADTDPDTPGVQAECFVEQSTTGGPEIELPACAVESGEYVLPSPDDDACYGLLTDPAAMSAECREEGWNLEVEIVRRPGQTPLPGLELSVVCRLSESATIDCPGLGG